MPVTTRSKNSFIKQFETDEVRCLEVSPLKNNELPPQECIKLYSVNFETPGAFDWEPKPEDQVSPYVDLNGTSDLNQLNNPDLTVINADTVSIMIDYPLELEWIFRIKRNGGWTRRQIAEDIIRIYHKIYELEDNTTQIDVGQLNPFIINRNRTDGIFGIWGHVISDLVLHTVDVYSYKNEVILGLGIDS